MKLTINVDVTPQEARAFFGMPDVEGLNQLIVAEMAKRAKDQMDTLADPEKLVAQWMSLGGKSAEAFKTVMGAAVKKK